MTPATTTVDEFRSDAARVAAAAASIGAAFLPQWQALSAAVEQVGQAWCGSRVPEVGNLYERRLQPLADALPADRHERPESTWPAARAAGTQEPTPGQPQARSAEQAQGPAQAQGQPRVPAALMASCRIWTRHEIRQAIHSLAGNPDLPALQALSARAVACFLHTRSSLQQRLSAWQAMHGCGHDVDRLLALLEDVTLADRHGLADGWRQRQQLQRRLQQSGLAPRPAGRPQPFDTTPAHIAEWAELQALRSPLDGLSRLATLLADAAEVLQPLTATAAVPAIPATAADIHHRPPAHVPPHMLPTVPPNATQHTHPPAHPKLHAQPQSHAF